MKADAMPRDIPGHVIPPPEKRGLSESEAASYIGVGLTLFREMVADRRMPRPRRINRRVVWDRRELDLYFDQLPHDREEGAEANDDPYAEFIA
jgi:predicted DNA-binding transcriptional regulator AlpA